MARQTPPEARPRRPHPVRSRRRLRVARPSLRVGRLRHPVTVCPDGWSPPRCRVSRWWGTESGLQANSPAPVGTAAQALAVYVAHSFVEFLQRRLQLFAALLREVGL